MSRIGPIGNWYTARGLTRYEVEVFHDDLNKYQLIKGDNRSVVEQRARSKMAEWDDIWAKRSEHEKRVQSIEDKKRAADDRTREALASHAFGKVILREQVLVDIGQVGVGEQDIGFQMAAIQ